MEVSSCPTEVKLISGDYKIPVDLWEERGRYFFKFGFQASKPLQLHIKSMQNSHWHGYDEVNPRKAWSVAVSPRNDFQLQLMMGLNPFKAYDSELDLSWVPKTRFNSFKQKDLSIYQHQRVGAAQIYQRRATIIASEMGTGKTLMLILALEQASADFEKKYGKKPEIWYIAPRLPLKAFERELISWKANFRPDKMMTYEALIKEITNWEPGRKAPVFIAFDESSKLKNCTAQRTRAAQHLADTVRKEWPEDLIIVTMSGSPAPKSPVDWWSQAEITCPGFLREGDQHKFKNRLAIIRQTQGVDGVYPRLVTWRDSETKCDVCGQTRDHTDHSFDLCEIREDFHAFKESINEVGKLYRRLKGLVIIFFKKDCLDLPHKQYRVIQLKPAQNILRVANAIVKTSPTTIQGLTLLRELSDGFQYDEVKSEEKESCPLCKGTGRDTLRTEIKGTCPNCTASDVVSGAYGSQQILCGNHTPQYSESEVTCPKCGGEGLVHKFKRIIVETKCPKEQAIVDLLDEHEDIGRIVIYGGFTGSVDRCVAICLRQKWAVIRVDQGKETFYGDDGQIISGVNILSVFQDMLEQYPRIAFVANAASAGMGLTLTASPTIVYYSNTFNAEDRIQSEDRIHRPGMDLNLGATIIDLVHLPSDQKILDNLKAKRDLQALTLGEFEEALKQERIND